MRRFRGQTRMPMPQGAIVVGGQWGSEGKGAVIYELGVDYATHVRVGGPQAGHSIKLPSGEVLKLQTIPVGAALGKECLIGMASVVDPEVLWREVGWFARLGMPLDLTIDPNATVLTEAYREAENQHGLTARLGSTGKGVGAARAARIMRTAPAAGEYFRPDELPEGVRVADTREILRERLKDAHNGILVEAAQGIQLSLFSSGYYPFVTSSEATPTGSFADLGLPLSQAHSFESVGVFRTFPIRVAGNSGPLPNEITWEALEEERGVPIPDSEKTTTVTLKTRRVARWSAEVARRSVVEAGIDWATLTFLDYPYPEISGQIDWDRFPKRVKAYVSKRENDLGVPINLVGTGFGSYAWRKV